MQINRKKIKALFGNKMESGGTRMVFMFKSFVIKIPRIDFGWEIFLSGWLANVAERNKWKMIQKRTPYYDIWRPFLCPILFSSPLGIFVFMKRADKYLTETELKEWKLKNLPEGEEEYQYWFDDLHRRNVMWLKDRVVVVDYANVYR